MNDTPNIPDSANVSSGVPVEKLMALYDRIIARIPRGVDWWNRGETLKYISRSEHIFLLLSSFFAGCENHGTLYIDSWGGYQIRDYMMEAGVVKCADVFTKLYPLTIAKQELDEIHDQLDQDEMDDRYEIINSQMKKIEMQMPSEDYDEIQGLLWKFAQKHGLDMLLPPDENGRK